MKDIYILNSSLFLSQSSSGHIRRDLELMSTLRSVEQGVCSGYLRRKPSHGLERAFSDGEFRAVAAAPPKRAPSGGGKRHFG